MSANVVVFLGPTLDRASAEALLPATYLPPARQGDLLAASHAHPEAIALIDGYFDRVPAVWHKEILWALERGVSVFGGSSMGALRAAELADLGMYGIGEVFRKFRDGTYEDDDEVAVSHASSEHGFRASSEAMVNIRATFARALAAGVIGEATATALVEVAKRAFYPDRHYTTIFRSARGSGVDEVELRALERWLPSNRVDQKRADALELLGVLNGYLQAGLPPVRTAVPFSHTSNWDALLRQHPPGAPAGDSAVATHELLIDELILSERYPASCGAALTRALGVALSTRAVRAEPISSDAVHAAVEAFRIAHQLEDEASFERWIDEQRLSDEALSDFFTNEARLRRSIEAYGANLLPHLLDQLRVEGIFGELAQRVEAKLTAFGGDLPRDAEQMGLSESMLWAWFGQRSERGLPSSIQTYARGVLGLTPERVLLAISREYQYWRLTERRASEVAGSDTP